MQDSAAALREYYRVAEASLDEVNKAHNELYAAADSLTIEGEYLVFMRRRIRQR